MLGIRLRGLGFIGFRGLGYWGLAVRAVRVSGFGGLGFWVLGFRGLGVWALGFRDFEFRVWAECNRTGYRV